MHPLIVFLSKQAQAVRQLEAEAEQALHREKAPERYRGCLLEKVEILSSLPDGIQDLLSGLDPKLQQEVQTAIRDFARRAEQAMEVDSIFFMRQLLYPEDYEQGRPNSLEIFINNLQSKIDPS